MYAIVIVRIEKWLRLLRRLQLQQTMYVIAVVGVEGWLTLLRGNYAAE
jgi:hypothetical protein